MIGLGFSISEVVVSTPPDGGGEEELAFIGFKSGVYRLNGVASSLNALVENNGDWGSYNSEADVVADVGLVNSSPALTAAAFAVLQGGASVVANVVFAGEGATFSVAYADLDPIEQFYFQYNQVGTGTIDANGVTDSVAEAGVGAAIVRATFDDDNVAASIDGAAVVAVTPVSVPAFTVIGLTISEGVIEDLTFYAPQPNAGLPVLPAGS